jgi:pimeloyl-ACP methyl ester carboxylesterase
MTRNYQAVGYYSYTHRYNTLKPIILKEALILLIIICLKISCGSAERDGQSQNQLVTKREFNIHDELSIVDSDGDSIFYEIGTILVPENRNDLNSRMIGVGFLRLHSKIKNPIAPPIFALPGGPGYSFVKGFKNQKGQMGEKFSDIAEFTAFTDVILVDQRGFSEYGDELKATFIRKRNPLPMDEKIAQDKRFAEETTAEFAKGEIDLSGYTAIECAHDVNELRHALGYESISLYAWSFGSQWSFILMRLFPETITRAVLSGVEPINNEFDMPSDVMAAIHRIWKSIDEDERFTPYLPEGGMAELAQSVLQKVEQNPIVVNENMTIGPTNIPWTNPSVLLWIYNEDKALYLDWFKNRYTIRSNQKKLIGLLINSSLSVTKERENQLWADTASRYLGQNKFASLLATKDIWPTPDIGDELRKPVKSDIPVVFLQGDWDLNTPVENTYEIAPYFPNSHVLIAENGGHGVFGAIKKEHEAVWFEVKEFLKTGDMEGIERKVKVKPAFSFSAPYPSETQN